LATWSHVIPALALPRGVAYIPIALSGLLILGFSIERIVIEAKAREVRKTWN
jgi:TRAP-type C4-dicarboxylate transport system permease small subunit